MSTRNKLGKLITRFEIGFDNETKADIDALKAKIDELTAALSVKNDNHGDRLLAAMQAEAANDAPQPELKQMGQWVFEGQDAKWVSAAVNTDGRAYLHNMPKNSMYFNHSSYGWCSRRFDLHEMQLIGGSFNPSGFAVGFIERETVNDVDYLSAGLDESVPHIDDVLDQPHWLSESVSQITQDDMQLIFIKNLSETLTQRMHSMGRFSEDDYAIGGKQLKAWDIVTGQAYNKQLFGVVFAQQHSSKEHLNKVDVILLEQKGSHGMIAAFANIYFTDNDTYRTIAEAELPAFRAALEACYA